MPSPFGERRGPNSYYQYGGTPRRYVYNWSGVPQAANTRGAEGRALGNYPVSMTLESGRYSVLHSGPEALAAAQLSRNETRLAIAVGLLGAGFLAWKVWGR